MFAGPLHSDLFFSLWRQHRRETRAIWRRCRSDLRPPNWRPVHAARPRAPITYTPDPGSIDVAELADLVCLCATFAPGTALDADPDGAAAASSPRLRRRLAVALRNSIECVAAYAPESALPAHRHLHARGLGPPPPAAGGAAWQSLLPWQQRKVLVGFARAVGDGALVSTVHDVAVMPELRGKGVGAGLMQRLTRQVRGAAFSVSGMFRVPPAVCHRATLYHAR
jgi:GNAT superfamily N-acetyltransferase